LNNLPNPAVITIPPKFVDMIRITDLDRVNPTKDDVNLWGVPFLIIAFGRFSFIMLMAWLVGKHSLVDAGVWLGASIAVL
jgi:hypothetical protein